MHICANRRNLINHLVQVFSSLEERNDAGDRLGYVASGSLSKLFDLMDYSISKEEVKDLVAKYDRNGRGFIDFDSFEDLSKVALLICAC